MTGSSPVPRDSSPVTSDGRARELLAGGFDRWEAAFREGLDAMRTNGLLRAEADTHGLALTLLAALQGGLLLSRTRRDAAPLEVALDGALATIRAAAAEPTSPRPARPPRRNP